MDKAMGLAEAPGETEVKENGHKPPGFWILTLGSIGVVYGDIGTSPPICRARGGARGVTQ